MKLMMEKWNTIKGKLLTTAFAFALVTSVFAGLTIGGEANSIVGTTTPAAQADGASMEMWNADRSLEIVSDIVGAAGLAGSSTNWMSDVGNWNSPWVNLDTARAQVSWMIGNVGYTISGDMTLVSGSGFQLFTTADPIVQMVVPAGLHAGAGTNQIDLTWPAPSDPNVMGFLIYRSTDNATWALIEGTTGYQAGFWWAQACNLERATAWHVGNAYSDTTIPAEDVDYYYAIRYVYGPQTDGLGIPTTQHGQWGLQNPDGFFTPVYSGGSAPIPTPSGAPVPPTVYAKEPGETFGLSLTGGSNYPVTWSANDDAAWPNGGNVINITYSTTGAGGAWNPWANDLFDDGSETLAVPAVNSVNCYINVSAWDADGNEVSDLGNNSFEIDSTTPVPSPTPANGTTGVSPTVTYSFDFGEGMQTAIGETVTIEPTPVVAGVWIWAGGRWYNYTGATFAESTMYWVNITADTFADNSAPGNFVPFYSFEFTTGDFTLPTATPTPTDGTTGVPVGLGTYTITFSEPMQAVGTFSTDQLPAGSGWSWTSTTTYEKTGLPALSGETQYIVAINNNFFDLAGNPVTGDISWYFVTEDITGPTATPTPADGATGVATALGTYTITFNEDMQAVGAPTVDDLPAGSGWSWTSTTTYEKTGLPALAETTTYNVDLTGGGFVDLAGNPVTGDITFDFTTADETGPTATPTPADGATGVSVALGTYTITFNEPMQPTGTFATDDLPAGSGWSWTSSTLYEKTGLPALTGETTYNVILNTDFVDLAGNPITGDITWFFVTEDITSPTATPTPADGATGVATALGTYTITFNEPMQAVGTLATDTIPSGAWGWTDNMHYEKTGIGALAEVTTYDVVLNNDFLDLAGNPVTGDITFDFTTADETGPTATPTPADGATGVATALGTYTITFNEDMQAVGAPTVDDLPAGSGWSWTSTTTFEKTGLPALAEQTNYNIDLTSGGFVDLVGNPATGDITFDFTTADETGPTATPTPADGATGVATALGTYTITFNEPMQAVGAPTVDDLPAGSGWSWTSTTVYEKTGLPALAEVTTYNVDLTSGGFVDVAGNPLTGDMTFDFTTADETGPTATPTPADGATSVATALGTYTITFNEPMQAVGTPTVDDLPAGSGWSWTSTTTYEKTGLPALAEMTTYNVDLAGGGFADVAGNPATGDITFDFTTADETTPTATPTPADGATGVGNNTNYSIAFSEIMNTGLGTATIEPALGANETGTWAWDATGQWYNYTGMEWNESTMYYVNLTGFQDTTGNALTGDVQYNFTTADNTDPVADAGPDQTVVPGTLVTFNGSGSTDNVGIVNYTWTFTDGTGQTLNGTSPTYTFNNIGSFLVTLNVSDAAGNWDTDTMWVNVTDGTAPVADAGPDQTVPQGTLVVFDGSGSTDNVGIVNYTWTFNDGVGRTLYGVGPSYTFANMGTYLVTLTVTDAAGNSDTDTMTVSVTDATDPVADAGPDQAVVEGTEVTFDGSDSTDNVGVDNYTWTFTEGTARTLYGASPTYVFNNVGNFEVTLTVTDAEGNSDTDTMWVNVTAAPLDTDGDGTPDSVDTDDDGDGFLDTWEEFLGTSTTDATDTPTDTDGDGIPDGDSGNTESWMDTDDDGDGVLDVDDPDPLDPDVTTDDGGGIGDYWWIILIIIIVVIVALLAFFMKAGRSPPETIPEKEDEADAAEESEETFDAETDEFAE